MQRCRCNDETLFLDAEGDAYPDHLGQESVDRHGHVAYRCPFSGHRWLGEFVSAAEGTRLELRRVTSGRRKLRPAKPDSSAA